MNPINLYKPIENNSAGNKNRQTESRREVNFAGLNTALTRTIYVSPELIQKMLGIYPKAQGSVGTLPKEMISVLRKNTNSSVDIGKKINEIKSAFAEAADFLREKDKEVLRNLDSIDFEKYFDNIQDMNELGKHNAMEPNSSKEFMETLHIRSSEFLTDSMKKIGLIPQNGKVQVKHLGEGASGNAYKISFLDANGEKIFHDKVLKVYKDLNASSEVQKRIGSKILKYIEKMNEWIDKNPNIPDDIKASVKDSLGNISEKNINELTGFMQDMKDIYNGPEAEANAALYIKKAIGHPLGKSDLINPYFFDLRHNMGFIEMADDSLPTITKHTDFKKLGIRHNDLDMNPGNKVEGRIIDYGGIMIDNDTLVKNKEARRKFKHST